MTVSLMNFDMATLNNEDISIWEEITSVFISSYLQNFLSYISVHIDLRKQEFGTYNCVYCYSKLINI